MPERKCFLRSIALGAISGIVATLAMDFFLKIASSSQQVIEKQEKLAEGESPWAIAHEEVQHQRQSRHQEGSTEIVARKLSEAAGHHLPEERKKSAGQAVHFTFGTLMGVLYVTVAEYLPEATAGGGLGYGTILFLTADELAVPAFKLSPPPTQTPASNHLKHWFAHLVYGGTLEFCRNLLRRI